MRNLVLTSAVLGLLLSTSVAADCRLYGVQDGGLNDTQFFSVDMDSLEVQTLGEVYAGYDVEGLAIHPNSNAVFASAGDKGAMAGMLYQLNTEDGSLTEVGASGFNELDSLAFDPSGQLWGWADGAGLVTLNQTSTGDASPQASLVIPAADLIVQDMTWSQDGHDLYLVSGQDLLRFNTETVTTHLVCSLPAEVEALETYNADTLLFSMHNDASGQIKALLLTEDGCEMLDDDSITTGFDDVEGIALAVEACQPEPEPEPEEPVQLPEEGGVVSLQGNMGCVDENYAAIQFNLNLNVFADTHQFTGNGFAQDYDTSDLYFTLTGWYDANMQINATMSIYNYWLGMWILVRTDYIDGQFDATGHLYDLTQTLFTPGIEGCDAYVNFYLQ